MPPPPDPAEAPKRHHRPRWVRVLKIAFYLAAIGLSVWAVSGKTDELTGATSYFSHLNWGWIAVAAGAEFLSYLAFAELQRRLLHAGQVATPLGPMTGITVAGNSIQNSLPAGVVLSAAFAFRQYRRYGADEILASWVLVAMTILSLMSLTALAVVGLAMAASTGSALDLASVIIGVVVVMVALWVAWRKRAWLIDRSVTLVRLSQRLVHRPEGDADAIVADARTRLGAITPTHREWTSASLMALGNWFFDMTCLGIAFLAVDSSIPWRGLLLAYAAAQLAANLPVTPGGLGVVEGSLTLALVAFGGAEATTVAAVLIYRLLSFWVTLPIGWAVWGTLSFKGRRASTRPPVGTGTPLATAAEPV